MGFGVPTRRLNEQVRRNANRFPPDFAFVLTEQEVTNLKSQFATSSVGLIRSQFATGSTHGGRRKLPMAFTEHGAIMAANVLRSKRAIQMSVFVVRAFTRMRQMLIEQRWRSANEPFFETASGIDSFARKTQRELNLDHFLTATYTHCTPCIP